MVNGWHVQRVVLHPFTISRTDVEPNPQPLVVVWMGPVVGVLASLAMWFVTHRLKLRGAFVLRFFAGFSLIANGLYVGFGSIERIGDAGEMLSHGSPIWMLWLFGCVTVPLGFCLWNGQGRYFGLGKHAEPIDAGVMMGVAATAAGLMVLGVLLGNG